MYTVFSLYSILINFPFSRDHWIKICNKLILSPSDVTNMYSDIEKWPTHQETKSEQVLQILLQVAPCSVS